MLKIFFMLSFFPFLLVATNLSWENINFPVEWIDVTPSKLTISHGKIGKVIASRGKNGNIAIVWGGRAMFELKNLSLVNNEKIVCNIKRFTRQNNKGWSAALLGCYNQSG